MKAKDFKVGDEMVYCSENFILDEIRFSDVINENMYFFWSKHNRLFLREGQLDDILSHGKVERKKK